MNQFDSMLLIELARSKYHDAIVDVNGVISFSRKADGTVGQHRFRVNETETSPHDLPPEVLTAHQMSLTEAMARGPVTDRDLSDATMEAIKAYLLQNPPTLPVLETPITINWLQDTLDDQINPRPETPDDESD